MPLTDQEFDFLQGIFQRLTEEPLRPGEDDRYEPIYETFENDDPIERLARAIRFSSGHSRQFFSGFRGTGKSTELYRLKARLEAENYLVYYANALEYLNPALPIEIGDLLVILAGAFSEAVEAREKEVGLLKESYWERLRNFLFNTQVELEGIDLSVPSEAVKLKLAIKDTPTIRKRLQHELTIRLSEIERQIHQLFKDYVVELRRRYNPRGVVFLFDNLEQLRGARSDQHVTESVERLFRLHSDRLTIPFIHTVYTVPPLLKFQLPGTEVEMLPTIIQWMNNSQRSPVEAGSERLTSVMRRRFRDEGFHKFFGEGSQSGALVRACGGNFRDLIRLAREAVLRTDRLPVSEGAIRASIRAIREQFLPIAIDDAIWLERIARNRNLVLSNSSNEIVGRLSLFLDTHLVLYFRNGDEWYDVHPLIRENVEQIAAAEEAEARNGKKTEA